MSLYPHVETTKNIIACAITVHRVLGPGLLESVYQRCLASEFRHEGIPNRAQVAIPIVYREEVIPVCYRLDFVVDDKVIVEIKASDTVSPVFLAQVLTYLKLTNLQLALLVNFNASPLRSGIKRIVNPRYQCRSDVSDVSVAE